MTDRVQQIFNNATMIPSSNSQQLVAVPHNQGQQQQAVFGHSATTHWGHKDGSAIPPKLRGKRRATTPASSDLNKPQQMGLPSTSTTTPLPAVNTATHQIPNEYSPTSFSSDTSSLQRLQQHRSQIHNTISIVSPGSPSGIVQSSQQQQLLDQQAYRPPKLQKAAARRRGSVTSFEPSAVGVSANVDQSQQRRLAPIVIPTPRHYHPGQVNQILMTATGLRYNETEEIHYVLDFDDQRMDIYVQDIDIESCDCPSGDCLGPCHDHVPGSKVRVRLADDQLYGATFRRAYSTTRYTLRDDELHASLSSKRHPVGMGGGGKPKKSRQDKPSPPRGPLEVSNVFEDSCDLTWQSPADDDGEPVEFYEVEKMDQSTGKWVPVDRASGSQFHVDGLKKGQNYMFRVKAINKEGESEPLITEKETLAKNPYDEPGKPGKPEPTDWDVDSVELEWDKPAKDGGTPITGYVIEKKSKHAKDWTKAMEVLEPKTKALVLGLKEGEEYQFRVRAINKAGPGEASEPSESVIAKARNLKPHIEREFMKPVTVKVGHNVEYDVPVRGEPPPEMVWTSKGQTLDTGGNLKINNEDYKTRFSLKGATRKDAGEYTLTATNVNGKDEHDVDVIVLGEPTAPQGPLEVKDVYEDQMTVEWQTPDDDGGVPIDHYDVEKVDVATGRWVPAGRANGTSFTAQNLQGGHNYKFRVKAVNKEGESEPLTTEKETLAKNPYDQPGKMDKLKLVDWDKDQVDLEWQPPANDGGAPISGYVIEKKDKRGKWTKAKEVPAGETSARADGLDEGEEYQFRIAAVNTAGPGEFSEQSDQVLVKPRFLAPRINRHDIPMTPVKVGQPVKFSVNISGEPPPDVAWEFAGKPVRGGDGVEVQNPDYLSKFLIDNAQRKHAGVWKIIVTNSSGKDEAEVQINVLGRPSKPKGPLNVSEVFEDRMTLDWQPPDDDGGTPIDHYDIEKLGPAIGQRVLCGPSKDTKFQVGNLQKGKCYKFRVKAVNAEGPSDPLETDQATVAKNPLVNFACAFVFRRFN